MCRQQIGARWDRWVYIDGRCPGKELKIDETEIKEFSLVRPH